MKVAIVHEWLVTYAGSERALEQILAIYPGADLYSVVDFLPIEDRSMLQGRVPKTSFLQSLPFARSRHRSYLPLMPLAVKRFDLSGYDLVISSSHAVAKGVSTGPDQLHVSYVYTPMRYAWDLREQYLVESGLDRGLKGLLARWMLDRLRAWDAGTADGVDFFAAISNYIARRIETSYGREAAVVYPPVDVSYFTIGEAREEFYLTASRMVPYKKISTIVEAFAWLPDKRLVVIGDGPEREKIARLASGNVTLLGHQPRAVLRDYMQRARAFLFAAEEDFGIVPLEAQACGTPVIAYGKGGVLETVRGLEAAEPTGLFFDVQAPESIADAVLRFEANQSRILPTACRENALAFAPERFRAEFSAFVEDAWKAWRERRETAGSPEKCG
jgi:glycosyltransferase involved in cell wall biosynthesis